MDKLHPLRCTAMATALAEPLGAPETEALSFHERLGRLVDRELTERHSRPLTNRLRRARLRHAACVEDIDFRQPRGLDKDLVLSLADGRWGPRPSQLTAHGAGRGRKDVDCLCADP